jgi:hypothetical protein
LAKLAWEVELLGAQAVEPKVFETNLYNKKVSEYRGQ